MIKIIDILQVVLTLKCQPIKTVLFSAAIDWVS